MGAPGGGRQPPQGRIPQSDPPDEPDEDPQGEPHPEVEFSLEPNQGAARGRRDEVTPARVVFREREEREEGEDYMRRELNLREAQLTALEREVATLRARSRTS